MEAYEEINKVLGSNYSSNKEVDWEYISVTKALTQSLSVEIMRKIKDYIDWKGYTYINGKYFSVDFIREFKDYVDWDILCSIKDFTPELIEEFEDRLSWCVISSHQKLSTSFIIRHIDKISIPDLKLNFHLEEETLILLDMYFLHKRLSWNLERSCFDYLMYG